MTRRQALRQAGIGLGSLALGSVLARADGGTQAATDLSVRSGHFPGTAKRVIHLFMNGGPSQVDTFDPKPKLRQMHGKPLPGGKWKGDRRMGGACFASPFSFRRHGRSGLPVSELFPETARHADDLCVIRSMQSDVPNHEPGLMMMNTGSIALPRPSVGSWLMYGLGTENQSLPGYVVLCPSGLPTAQSANWRNAFLPGMFQGTHVDTSKRDPEELITNIRNNRMLAKQQRRQMGYLQQLNNLHRDSRPHAPQLEARIRSMELAFRMQTDAMEAFDVSREPESVLDRYGNTIWGRQMILARRLAERGVRYVQVYHGAGQPWDSHNKMEEAHRRLAGQADRPIGALLDDLKERGMLEDTLVIWGGEMGRTPTVQLPATAKAGRDHHTDGFSIWMAAPPTNSARWWSTSRCMYTTSMRRSCT